MTSKEQVRREIDEAIERIDAKLATASPGDENEQLQDERDDWERARSGLDDSGST